MPDTKIVGASQVRESSLSISRDEFITRLKQACVEDNKGSNTQSDKKFRLSLDGDKFRVRMNTRQSAFARVLYGKLSPEKHGLTLRYYLAVRRELKRPLALFSAVVAMIFLVLLYGNPPASGAEYLYLLPLLLPLSIAVLMTNGIKSGQAQELELQSFITQISD